MFKEKWNINQQLFEIEKNQCVNLFSSVASGEILRKFNLQFTCFKFQQNIYRGLQSI